MTKIKEGLPFHLYPPEHPDDVAAAAAANLAAMRKHKEQKLIRAASSADAHHARQMIHEHHEHMERELMKGVELQKQMHAEFVAQHPEVKDFRWSKSDPPGTPRHDPEHYTKMMKALNDYTRKQFLKRGVKNIK